MKKDSGQALLVILLVMAVGLTIGLSIISRSVVDLRISEQEEESARAFSAAEAGIEEALIMNLSAGESHTNSVGGIDFVVTAENEGLSSGFDFGGSQFEEGDVRTVWLVGHDENGNPSSSAGSYNGDSITVCWGSEDTAEESALEVSLVYSEAGTFKIARGAYDANFPRTITNNFDRADDTDGGNCGDFAFGEDISLADDFNMLATATPYALRLKLLYNGEPEPLAVSSGGGGDFPSQGSCYQSTASSGEGDNRITRRVQQCQFHPAPPGILDYVLFSKGDLTHN